MLHSAKPLPSAKGSLPSVKTLGKAAASSSVVVLDEVYNFVVNNFFIKYFFAECPDKKHSVKSQAVSKVQFSSSDTTGRTCIKASPIEREILKQWEPGTGGRKKSVLTETNKKTNQRCVQFF